MQNLTSFFNGKKTYLVALAMVIYGVAGLFLHQLTQDQAAAFIFQALGFSAIRKSLSSGSGI